MKTQENRIKEQRHLLFQADIEATINALFRRCPTLCGFSVRDATDSSRDRSALQHRGELFVTEVSVYPMRDLYPPAELGDEIVATLAALLEECPEACALLRDRTFARVLH
jgi:hypothetical protein